jgi:colanic acid biosynthesis glycosyl transferase WcaI
LQFLRCSRLRQMATLLEQQCLRGFDKVSTISEKMRLRLLDKGLEPERCLLFPNWVDTTAIHPLQGPSPFREELGIDPNTVVALYSGTMAQKQGLDILAEVACKLQSHADLKFVFCGDGPGRPKLERMVAQLKNIYWLPLQSPERLNDLLNLADIHLLPQRANAADLVMPSKLTGMFASGRPVIAGAAGGTQLANVVDGRGIVVPPEDASALAWAIEQLATHPALRDKLGRNARAYAVSELEKAVVLRRFEEELCRVASSGAANRKLN